MRTNRERYAQPEAIKALIEEEQDLVLSLIQKLEDDKVEAAIVLKFKDPASDRPTQH